MSSPRPVRKASRSGVSPAVAAAAESECAALAASSAGRLLVFTGAGLSAGSGLAVFSSPGGLYERARRRCGLTDGQRLFTWAFFAKRRAESLSFLAELWSDVRAATPSRSHRALERLHAQGRLAGHVTLNVDGLHRALDCSTVELHGCALDAVCSGCGALSTVSPQQAAAWRAGKEEQACASCGARRMRPRVLLYDDAEAHLVTPGPTLSAALAPLRTDCDAVLWVGISFSQSSSVELFRTVRKALAGFGREESVTHIIVNPDGDAGFNLLSALSHSHGLRLLSARSSADDFLCVLAEGAPPAGTRGEDEREEPC